MAEDMPFTSEEIKKLRELLEVEAVRKVRNLYSHLLDSGDIDALAAIFTEDAQCEFGPYGEWQGRETIRTSYQQVFRDEIKQTFGSMHNTGNHWVELTSPTTAVGRIYLIDALTHRDPAGNPFEWLGVYDDAYEKVGGAWLIKRMSLQFLWPKRQMTDGFPGLFPPKG
jgi:ketosteroid isomerase-like protein